MTVPKTRVSDTSVVDFIKSITNYKQREDSIQLLDVFKEATNEPAEVWGDIGIGFGRYTMTYADGKKRNWPVIGFPRAKIT